MLVCLSEKLKTNRQMKGNRLCKIINWKFIHSKLKYLELIFPILIWGINIREYQQQSILHSMGTLHSCMWSALGYGYSCWKGCKYQVIHGLRAWLQTYESKGFFLSLKWEQGKIFWESTEIVLLSSMLSVWSSF